MNEKKETHTAADAVDTGNPNPTGRCEWTNAAGQILCRDGMTKTACAAISGSVFTPGGTCP